MRFTVRASARERDLNHLFKSQAPHFLRHERSGAFRYDFLLFPSVKLFNRAEIPQKETINSSGGGTQRWWFRHCFASFISLRLGRGMFTHSLSEILASHTEMRPNQLWFKHLNISLGSTDPCSIVVDMETFSTSAFNVFRWIFATTTKICTNGCSTEAHANSFAATITHSYSRNGFSIPRRGWLWVDRLSIIHFRGQFIRQVSCYTLIMGYRLPWPPSCCLDEPTPFLGSDERPFGYLKPTLGSSRVTSLAYQKWST